MAGIKEDDESQQWKVATTRHRAATAMKPEIRKSLVAWTFRQATGRRREGAALLAPRLTGTW